MFGARAGRSLLVLGACATLLLMTGCSRKGDISGWKAPVEIVNGVKTVTNPESPRYGEFAFDLAENLAIGNDSEDVLSLPNRGTDRRGQRR